MSCDLEILTEMSNIYICTKNYNITEKVSYATQYSIQVIILTIFVLDKILHLTSTKVKQ